MSLLTTATLKLLANYTGSGSFLGTAEQEVPLDLSDVLADGTGADQADKIFTQSYDIAAAANQDLDLAGSLTDPFGATITFARVKMIIINVVTATAGYTVVVGGGDDGSGNNAFSTIFANASDKIVVRGGGTLILLAPDATAYAVTAGTGDILRINNPSAGTVTVRVVIIGASA